MSKLKVDQFVDLVKRSGLVDNERLNQALSGVDQSIKDSGIIASNLTKAGLLTEWQSEKLLQGKHKGFYLGKYRLLNHIGAGGMGSVYLAEHIVMGHQVAIKLLPNHLAAHASYVERFHQEARASAKLNHPNMVRSIDVDQDGNNHYLVMEYVDGSDLQAIVSRNGPLPYKAAAEYARQAAEGLSYAHRSGLIHRDIKPANLLVERTGTVKILDMGLARFTDESQGSLTMAYDQKMIGTVDYLAPEQAIDSHNVDGRVDIYSLGCTLYFMLTGDAPFPQGTIAQRIMQHQSAEPADIRKVRADAPETLIQICRKMMAKSAQDRYQSSDQVAQALADWLADRGTRPGDSQAIYIPPTPVGPSLNDDLDLAPLDDAPNGRSKQPAKEPKPGESKTSGIGAKSAAGKPEQSAVKKGQPSAIKNGPAASGVKRGEQSGVKPAPSTIKGPSPGKGSSAGKPAPPLKDLTKDNDLMDELLSVPTLPAAQSMPSVSLPSPRKKKEEPVFPLWLVLGLGTLGGLLLVVIISVVAWATGML